MSDRRRVDWLLPLTLLYAGASLFHHVHNALYLHAYPHMPASLSAPRVYAAWFATTLVGVAGFLMTRRGHPVAGLLVLAAYAGLGLLGLAHYALAPPSAHSLAMNASILTEVAAAVLLLIHIATRLLALRRAARTGRPDAGA